MSSPSTEEDYNKLPLDKLGLRNTSFEKFSHAREKDIDKLCDCKGLTFDQLLDIRSVWDNHPKRQTTTTAVVDTNHVFVLGSDNRVCKEEGEVEGALATAFAIGPKAVLSCSHCLTLHRRDEDLESTGTMGEGSAKLSSLRLLKEYNTEYWLSPFLSEKVQPQNKIMIQLVKHHIDNDWAVFKRVDGKEFEDFAEVDDRLGPSVEPQNRAMERMLALWQQNVTVIHCPVSEYLEDLENGTPCNVGPIFQTSMVHSLTEHHIKHGVMTYSGSSGGAVHIHGCPKAIGWHCCVTNRVKLSVSKEEEKDSREAEGKAKVAKTNVANPTVAGLNDILQSVSDTIASVLGGTNTQGVANIISRHPKLMYYIAEVNAGRL